MPEDGFTADGPAFLCSGASQSGDEEVGSGLTSLRLSDEPDWHSTTTGPRILLVFRIAVLRCPLCAFPPSGRMPDDWSRRARADDFLDCVAMRGRHRGQLPAYDGGGSPSGQQRLPLLGRAQECIKFAKAETFNIDLHVFFEG